MGKETKNVITRETVKEELLFYNTADIRTILVICIPLLLLCIPIFIAVYYAIFLLKEDMWLKIVLSVFLVITACLPISYPVLLLAKSLIERKRIKQDEFYIVNRQLLYKSEKIKHGFQHGRYEELLHFKDFKEFAVEHIIYQLSSGGEDFYIVYFNGSKSIERVYPAKMYEYRET